MAQKPMRRKASGKTEYTDEKQRRRISQVKRVSPDPSKGLTEAQVKERMSLGAVNHKVTSSTKAVSEIVRSNVFTYFNLIFLVLGILLLAVGAFRDMLFLLVIIANTCIGIFQEIHAKNVLDRLSLLNSSKTTVIRDGNEKLLAQDKLVLDDVVVLDAGKQIPADAIVLDGEAQVNESLITGEADEVEKKIGDTLLSGSYIVSGKVIARLDKVGRDSYINKLTLQATESKEGEQSEMIRSLNRLIMVMGIIIIPIGIALFVQSYFFNGESAHDSITSMVAAVTGMIPEGLYLLASVSMAVSTTRLAGKKVLVHDMKCIETLARVDVLCTDKTGTITEPGMKVHGLVFLDGAAELVTEAAVSQFGGSAEDIALLSGSSVKEIGTSSGEGDENEKVQEVKDDEPADSDENRKLRRKVISKYIRMLLADFAYNMPPDNATMEAMQDAFDKMSGKRQSRKVSTFSSQTKYSGVEFNDGVYVLGAPEFILRDQYDAYKNKIEKQSALGYRVLIFAKYDGELDGHALTGSVLPLALVLLTNPIRSGAKETFSYFAGRGVDIKVISGDNPVTVSVIAAQAGIKNADRYVDCQTLKTKKDFEMAVDYYTIFGRVTPNQKRTLVAALQAKGRTVAMTGDGVNDVLALKDADCSIAMASGSDAASNVAQLVLLDSDFSRMPSVVMEGRRVVNNIQRTASLYIVKNLFSMLLSIFSVLLMLNYPLQPSQVSLISMFTIGIPSFILALEPNKDPIEGHFLVNVLVKALPAGLTDFLVVSSLVLFCREFNVDTNCLSTSCTILVAIVGFMILYRIAKPMNRMHIVMIIALIAGWLYCMLFVSHLFAITSISKQCAMLMVVFAIITEPALRYISILVEKLDHIIRKK